jgi:GAF domain-containing protein
MEPYSTHDHTSSTGAEPRGPGRRPEKLASSVGFPGEESGRSLAEMAHRDLDAALQLLADRAQYITGASGAAIALRRRGKNDMLCRASTGSNAPELGALLSTEFGLSGESVRTRQPLRCDDAERDVRVNREVCRQMGIASVVVMPVVNDDEVLGVFELFSGKANAFGVREVSAVERLSEMVETAVRLAQATENLPERLKMGEVSAPEVKGIEVQEDQILDGEVLEDLVLQEPVLEDPILEEPEPVVKVAVEGTSGAEALTEKESSIAALEALRHPKADFSGNREAGALDPPSHPTSDSSGNREAAAPEPLNAKIAALAPETLIAKTPTPPTGSGQALSQEAREDDANVVEEAVAAAPVAAPETAPKKKLFWSAGPNPAADAGRPEAPDQSHVPPVLRNLRKCEACGFPVSAGRVLCVECEEKKWRGQLRVPKAGAPRQTAMPSPVAEKVGTSGAEALTQNRGSIAALEALRHPKAGSSANALAVNPSAVPVVAAVPAVGAAPVVAAPRAEARAFAAAAQSAAVSSPVPGASTVAAHTGAIPALPAARAKESKEVGQAMAAGPASSAPARTAAVSTSKVSSPEFVLSAGMKPSQSWLSANKYIIGTLLVVSAVVAAVFLLR